VLGEGNHGRFYLARPPARLGLPDEFVAVKVFSGRHSE
jgi:eukaryotic-like serine/threonine-protein kinase